MRVRVDPRHIFHTKEGGGVVRLSYSPDRREAGEGIINYFLSRPDCVRARSRGFNANWSRRERIRGEIRDARIVRTSFCTSNPSLSPIC